MRNVLWTSSCHFDAAFTNEPVFLLVGAAFFLFGLWMLYSILRKRNTRAG